VALTPFFSTWVTPFFEKVALTPFFAAAAHIRERLKGMNPETRTAFLRAYPLASLRSSGNHRWLHDQVIGPALCHWSPDELEEGEQLAPLNRHCR
jgi:hypothetical protein